MDSFGHRLRLAREYAGFTQEKLAEYVGVSRTAVARWESNDIEPKIQNLVRIAVLLNVSTDSLLGVKSSNVYGLSENAIDALSKFIDEVKKKV